MFLLVGHEENVIYSKLVNNPFKYILTMLHLDLGLELNYSGETFKNCAPKTCCYEIVKLKTRLKTPKTDHLKKFFSLQPSNTLVGLQRSSG